MAAISITPASVLPGTGAKTKTGTAGGTITAGMTVYLDTSDSNSVKPADADAEASAVVAGIALNGASDGQPVTYQYAGPITIGGTVVAGTPYFVHTTAGGLGVISELTTGDYVSYIGIATSASVINLKMHVSGTAVPA